MKRIFITKFLLQLTPWHWEMQEKLTDEILK